ncbi:MAG: DUF72 domain-containing protein [Acidimicrobiales bacterium]|nr:DUF72 domain-containing protein [Acidimicrobiales bacterium]
MHPLLHVGCPMWAHRPWTGRFLPSSTPGGRELHPYSRFVNAVEGNTTFYASPAPATVRKWAELAHPDFRFVFKLPKRITHELRLRDADAEIAAFVELLAPLGALVGGMTLQLPSSFAPVDLGVLEAQIRRLPGGIAWSVEVRHPAFFEGPTRAALDRMLARNEVERVLLDSRALFRRPPLTDAGREAWSRKPRIPALTEALTDRPVVRFIGSDDPTVTADGLQEWQPIVADWLHEGRTPTFFVHTPDNADSPGLARTFHAEVGLLVPELAPLPDPLPLVVAEQGSLF